LPPLRPPLCRWLFLFTPPPTGSTGTKIEFVIDNDELIVSVFEEIVRLTGSLGGGRVGTGGGWRVP